MRRIVSSARLPFDARLLAGSDEIRLKPATAAPDGKINIKGPLTPSERRKRTGRFPPNNRHAAVAKVATYETPETQHIRDK